VTALWLCLPAAVAVVALPALRHGARRWGARIPRGLPEVLAPVALVLLTAGVYSPLLKGHAPTTWDNNYDVLKTVETEDLLARHELFGWSDFEDAGFPANANYPAAGALLASALDALPGVPLQATGAYCALLAMLSMVLACYLAGRLSFGKWVGLIAGALALFDPGGWWVGGHFMAVEVGMWIQTVSAALTVAGLALWPRAVARGGAWVPLSGAALGAAVLFHPQAVPLACAAGVVMLLALLATPGLPTRQVLARTGWIAALALATSGWWLFQDLSHVGFSQLPSVDPPHTAALWSALADGSLLHGPALWLGACAIGVLMLARRRDPWSVFLAVCVPALAIVFTCEALDLFHLRAPWTGGLMNRLQLTRMAYLQRPLAFVTVAYALGLASRQLGSSLARKPARAWGWVGRVGVAGLLITLGMLPGFAVPGWPAKASPTGLSPREVAMENQALDVALRLLQPGERLVIRNTEWIDHDLIFQAALRQVKILNLGGDAALMFKNHFFTENPSLIERVG